MLDDVIGFSFSQLLININWLAWITWLLFTLLYPVPQRGGKCVIFQDQFRFVFTRELDAFTSEHRFPYGRNIKRLFDYSIFLVWAANL
jgi:hypothetical protein